MLPLLLVFLPKIIRLKLLVFLSCPLFSGSGIAVPFSFVLNGLTPLEL